MEAQTAARPSSAEASTPLPKITLTVHILLALMAGFLAFSLKKSIPAFTDVFMSFGAELPLLTRLLLDYPKALWIVFCLGLAYQLGWLVLWVVLRQRWAHIGLVLATVVNGLVYALTILALYLPILTLSSLI